VRVVVERHATLVTRESVNKCHEASHSSWVSEQPSETAVLALGHHQIESLNSDEVALFVSACLLLQSTLPGKLAVLLLLIIDRDDALELTLILLLLAVALLLDGASLSL